MTNGMPSIAVIVPAYNAEKSIARTLDSILAQTWQNVQAWVVDDGSQDGTSAIVESYVKRDSRVHLLRQSNQGPYAARLNALKHITTDYFGFVDSDDYIDASMYETLLNFALENDLEVASCSICGYSEDESSEILREKCAVLNKYIIPKLIEGRGNALITDKLYSVRCIPDCFIELKSKSFEDVILNMQFFQNISSYAHLPVGLYHYVVNPHSTTNKFRTREIEDFAEVLAVRKVLVRAFKCADLEEMLYSWAVVNLYNILTKAVNSGGGSFMNAYVNSRQVINSSVFKAAIGNCLSQAPRTHDVLMRLRFARNVTLLYVTKERLKSIVYIGVKRLLDMIFKFRG